MEIGWDGAMRTPYTAGEELIWYNLFAETLGNIYQSEKWGPVSGPTFISGLQRTSEPVPQEAHVRMAMATWLVISKWPQSHLIREIPETLFSENNRLSRGPYTTISVICL